MKSVWKMTRFDGYDVPILAPVEDEATKYARAGEGQEFVLDLSIKRSAKQLKLFHILLNFVVFHSDNFATVDALKIHLKLKLGHYKAFIQHNGQLGLKPKSLNVDEMEQVEFQEFFNNAMDIIFNEFVPTFNDQTELEFWRKVNQ